MVDFEEHRRANRSPEYYRAPDGTSGRTHYYITPEGQVFRPSPIESTQGYTPVVVIDPDDEATVRRLAHAYENHIGGGADSMQAALRSLLEPPKPPKPVEPLGFGAVVEEANGLRWVRVDTAHSDPMPWMANPSTTFQEAAWADFDAVTVLSPGVPDGEV